MGLHIEFLHRPAKRAAVAVLTGGGRWLVECVVKQWGHGGMQVMPEC